MTADEIEQLFTRSDGRYAFARWGRPVAPVVFGVEDETLRTVKGAIEAVARLTGRDVAETDPELGANFMVFFCRDWAELPGVPNLDRLIPDLGALVPRLEQADANQYRVFRFDERGAIRACFVFLRMDAHLSEMPAETLALSQVVQSALLWSDTAFRDRSPLAVTAGGATILRPEIGALVQAAYDPVMPDAADDPAHALRLAPRVERLR
ncbi:hypothetical protein [Tranquillimonas alkanivorans]|uniref:Uncharacterized protein n=1 Tax=Tranquillimonas alkanivorans TaxID=441119 RepID=A0A1I5N198_9RHOB|nr:hypothetical protein [Tranquillimonas alkanivorans]SFP15553.1 hypothetical protein SAMN04488047_10348 [Tranquillimonas alkanivorans]